jgi:hypothetical protein
MKIKRRIEKMYNTENRNETKQVDGRETDKR